MTADQSPDHDYHSPIEERAPVSMTHRVLSIAAPIALVVGVVVASQVIGSTGPKPEKKEEEQRPPAVRVALAERVDMRFEVKSQGQVFARNEADISAEAAGRIVWVRPDFVVGARVNAGETVMRVDKRDYELAMVRVDAQVAQARQALARVEAEAEAARQDWQDLGGANLGKASPLALREPQLAEARAALAAAQAQAEEARLGLVRTDVKAPFTGRLSDKSADLGQYVAPGARLARMFATDVMEVRLPLTDQDLATLRMPLAFSGNGPQVTLSAMVGGQTRQWTGRLVRTDAQVNNQTRLVTAFVEVRDPFGARQGAPLAPGLFVSASISAPGSASVVKAPRDALRRDSEVLVVDAEGKLDMRQVQVARSDESGVYFSSGVKPGEALVTSSLASPRDGLKVLVMDANGKVPEQAKPAKAADAGKDGAKAAAEPKQKT